MRIANPQGEVVEHFLTADCKSAGTPGGRLTDWESARTPDGRMGIANPQREVVEHFFDSGLQIRWNALRKTYWLRISQSAWRKTFRLRINRSAWRKTFWLYAEPITQHQKEPFFDLNQLFLRFNQNNWNLFLVFMYFLYLCPRIPIKKGRIPIKEDKTTYKTCNLNNV